MAMGMKRFDLDGSSGAGVYQNFFEMIRRDRMGPSWIPGARDRDIFLM
jgi:hypothetical protein